MTSNIRAMSLADSAPEDNCHVCTVLRPCKTGRDRASVPPATAVVGLAAVRTIAVGAATRMPRAADRPSALRAHHVAGVTGVLRAAIVVAAVVVAALLVAAVVLLARSVRTAVVVGRRLRRRAAIRPRRVLTAPAPARATERMSLRLTEVVVLGTHARVVAPRRPKHVERSRGRRTHASSPWWSDAGTDREQYQADERSTHDRAPPSRKFRRVTR